MSASFFFVRRFSYFDVASFVITAAVWDVHGAWALPVFVFLQALSAIGEQGTGVR